MDLWERRLIKTMKVTAKLDNLRIAPRKTKLVADLIRGLDTGDALDQLEMTVKRTSLPMRKLLLSAIANAESNFGLDKNNLYVFDAVVGAGPTLKRWMPKAYGRAGQILKRTSQITITLEERIEGKGRKTKEELIKERTAKLKEKRKAEQEAREDQEKKDKEEKKEESAKAKKALGLGKEKEIDKGKKEKAKRSLTSRIFRRKSM